MGLGNTLASFFGGFPAFGSLGRSAVNDGAGAKTQVSGFVTGFFVFLTAMWLVKAKVALTLSFHYFTTFPNQFVLLLL